MTPQELMTAPDPDWLVAEAIMLRNAESEAEQIAAEVERLRIKNLYGKTSLGS